MTGSRLQAARVLLKKPKGRRAELPGLASDEARRGAVLAARGACIITHSSMADGWSDKSAWAAVPGGERFASRLEPCPYCDSNSCREIECPNNPICGEVLQRCIADAHGGTCLNCAFGGLVVKDFTTATDDCPICLQQAELHVLLDCCLLYTSPSPRDGLLSRMPSSA